MGKYIQNKLKDQKGLTLIELLAVIVILAIIAAIAIPAISNIIQNSRVGAIKSDALNVINASELYFVDNADQTDVTLAELVTNGFIDDLGSFESPTTAGTVTTVTVVKKTATTATPSVITPTTIEGTGVVGGIQVAFTKASKDNIAAYSNNTRGAGTGTAVKVNAGDYVAPAAP